MTKYMYKKFGNLNCAYMYVIPIKSYYMVINLLCVFAF